MAAVVYNHHTSHNICMTYVGSPGTQWLTKGFLVAMWAYPFVQLKVNRVTGFIASKNTQSLSFAYRMGAKREGLMRQALPDDDIVVVGMLEEECRWV